MYHTTLQNSQNSIAYFFQINFSETAGSETRNEDAGNGSGESGKMGNFKTGNPRIKTLKWEILQIVHL